MPLRFYGKAERREFSAYAEWIRRYTLHLLIARLAYVC
jgi:hypothetical protein